jgi:hypothetical protein
MLTNHQIHGKMVTMQVMPRKRNDPAPPGTLVMRSVQLPAELHNRILGIARTEERSFNGQMIVIVREWLSKEGDRERGAD